MRPNVVTHYEVVAEAPESVFPLCWRGMCSSQELCKSPFYFFFFKLPDFLEVGEGNLFSICERYSRVEFKSVSPSAPPAPLPFVPLCREAMEGGARTARCLSEIEGQQCLLKKLQFLISSQLLLILFTCMLPWNWGVQHVGCKTLFDFLMCDLATFLLKIRYHSLALKTPRSSVEIIGTPVSSVCKVT